MQEVGARDGERRRPTPTLVPFGRRQTDQVALTDRQRHVLELVAEGYENKEIAADLVISEQAVKQQVTVLLRKFDVDTRGALVRSALAMRLLGIPEPTNVPYEYLFLRAPMLVAMSHGPEHRFTVVNTAFTACFGTRDYPGRRFCEVFADETAEFRTLLDGVYVTGEPARVYEHRVDANANGVRRTMYLSFVVEQVQARGAAIEGLAFYGWDVTDAVGARRDHDRLSANTELLDHLSVGVLIVDRHGFVTYVNPSGIRLLGGDLHRDRPLSAQAAEFGFRWAASGQIVVPGTGPTARALGGWPTDELILVGSEGAERRLRAKARPIAGASGEVVGAITTFEESR